MCGLLPTRLLTISLLNGYRLLFYTSPRTLLACTVRFQDESRLTIFLEWLQLLLMSMSSFPGPSISIHKRLWCDRSRTSERAGQELFSPLLTSPAFPLTPWAVLSASARSKIWRIRASYHRNPAPVETDSARQPCYCPYTLLSDQAQALVLVRNHMEIASILH